MKRLGATAVFGACLIFGAAHAATPTPLTLSYSITEPTAGEYSYDFHLTLDNNDGSWVSGQQWDWITFGDREGDPNQTSGFCPGLTCDSGSGTITTISPGISGTYSTGGHQGPTIQFGPIVTLPGWQPSAVGDSLEWTYSSTILLDQNDLYWSTLITTPNTHAALYNLATLTGEDLSAGVPEPATWAMMLAGIGAMGTVLRRSRQRLAATAKA
jgi:hypothetical protein